MPAPGSSSLTTEGKVVLLLALGFFAGALNTGTNLLYLVTALLASTLWANHRLARRALLALRVRRAAPEPGVVGGPLVLRVEVQAEGDAVRVPVAIEERAPEGWLEAPPRALALPLARDQQAASRVTARCARRGRVTLPGPALTTSAPFGLVERTAEVDDPLPVVVLPRALPVRAGVLDAHVPPTDAVARRLAFTQERRDVVRGLRDLRAGDDVRAVHWRSSARRGQLLVKEFERTAPQDAAVLLHLPAGSTPAAVEAAVTLAASLVAHVSRRNERATLGIAGAGEPVVVPGALGAAALRRAHEALALAAAATTEQEADLAAVEREARRVAGDARALLVSAAAGSAPAAPAVGLLARARRFAVGGPDDLRPLLVDERPARRKGGAA